MSHNSSGPFGVVGLDWHRVAKVVASGSGATGGRRGSGYRISDTLVLTAEHVVASVDHVEVRFNSGQPNEWSAAATVCFRDADNHLAILRLHAPDSRAALTPVRFGRIGDRAAKLEVQAVGFPRWKLRERQGEGPFRDSHHLIREVSTLSDLGAGTLEIPVTPPAEDPTGPPWGGMSGAAVWAADRIIAVIVENPLRAGLGWLTAVRIDKYLAKRGSRQQELASLLGIADSVDELVDVLSGQAIPGTIPAIATRPVDEQFTGRGWLVDEIESFMRTHNRGYFFIEGDACAGKTGFARHFAALGAARRPSHFTESGQAARTAEGAIGSLVRQIINEWRLEGFPADGLPPGTSDLQAWLCTAAGAAVRADRSADRRVVLVVDGLDEASESMPGSLPLGLPDDLPEHVYIVATARAGALTHMPPAPYLVCKLADRSVEDLNDRRAFLDGAVRRPKLAERLRASGVLSTDFIAAVLERCGDNWLYLRLVVDEAEEGQGPWDPTHVSRLPTSIEGYYYRNFHALHQEFKGVAWLPPVLATLAAAQEPLAADIVATLADTDDRAAVEQFLRRRFRPYCATWLTSEPDGQRQRFSLKHTIQRKLLTGETPPPAGQPQSFHDLHVDLGKAYKQAQQRICDRYADAWGGHHTAFAALAATPALAGLDGGYGLRRLPHHLAAAGRHAELHQMLRYPAGERNLWYAVHDDVGELNEYLKHVREARRHASSADCAMPDHQAIALQVRYHLIEASIVSWSATVPVALLGRLTAHRVWSATRALHHVARLTDEPARAKALAAIADHLPDDLVSDALTITLRLRDEDHRVRALRALIPRLSIDQLEIVAKAVEQLTPRTAVLAAIALFPHLPAHRRNAAYFRNRPEMFRALAAAEDHQTEQALASIEEVHFYRDDILAAIIPKLPADAFDRVVEILRTWKPNHRRETLIALARHAPRNRLTDLLELAADRATSSPDTRPSVWARMLEEAGPRLPAEDLPTALSFVAALDEWYRMEALAALAPHVPEALARQALANVPRLHPVDMWHEYQTHAAVDALAARLPHHDAVAVIKAHVETFRSDRTGRYIDSDLAIVRDDQPVTDEAPAVPPDFPMVFLVNYVPGATLRRAVRSLCLYVLFAVTHEQQDVCLAVLSRLVPWLCDDMIREEAFETAVHSAARHPEHRLKILSIVAPRLSEELLREAITRVVHGPAEVEFFGAIAALIQHLPWDRRETIAQRTLDTAQTTGRGWWVQAVRALAPGLTPRLATDALHLIQQGKFGFISTAQAIDALAGQLAVDQLPTALETVVRDLFFDDEDIVYIPQLLHRLGHDDRSGTLRTVFRLPQPRLRSDRTAEWLARLADYLSPSLAVEALSVARGFPPEQAREVMAALAPRLPEADRLSVVDEVIERLSSPPASINDRVHILGRLLEAAVTPAVVAACRELLTDPGSANAIGSGEGWKACLHLLANVPPVLAADALAFARPLRFERPFEAIRSLAPNLSGDILAEAVALVESSDQAHSDADDRDQALALIALARRTPNDQGERNRIVVSLLDRRINWRWWYVSGPVLTELIPLLPPSARHTATKLAVDAALTSWRAEEDLPNTRTLISLLRGPELTDVLANLDGLSDHRFRAEIIAAVLRRTSELPAEDRTATPTVALDRWAARTDRASIFVIIAASALWLRDKGGDRCVEEIIEAAFDVVRWWP